MLRDAPTHTALPVQDLDRARGFYSEKLGLEPAQETAEFQEQGLIYECGGQRFLLFKSTGRSSGAHTQMTWNVPDIEAAVAELGSRGVEFEEYDVPALKTVNGIAQTTGPDRGAWFRDSEGNMLGLNERG